MPSKEKIPWISNGHQSYCADFTEISVKTPGFWKKKLLGQFIADLDYQFENTRHQCSVETKPVELGAGPFSSNDVAPPPRFKALASGAPPPWLPAPLWKYTGNDELASARRQVLNKLRDKASAVDFNVLQASKEVKETASTIASVATQVYTSFRKLISGQPIEAINTLIYGVGPGRSMKDLGKGLSNAWLQWSYGIKPLISDVEGAMAQLDKSKDRPQTVLLKAFVGRVLSASNFWRTGSHRLDSYHAFSLEGTFTVTGKIFGLITSPVTKTADELGLLNPALLAWEVIPYSFVVDWFMPIGTYLQCMVPIRGLSLKTGFIYSKGTAEIKTLYGWNQIQSKGKAQSEFKHRQVLTGFPEFEMPAPDFSLNVEQALSAVSLLAQRILS